MTMKTTMIILAIILYLGYMIYLGVKMAKKNKSSDDFYLGGRKLGPFVTAMSAEASDMSSWLLMGLPGVALLNGLSGNTTGFAEAVWTAVGLAIGTYINWLIVAKRIRIYSEKTSSTTIPSLFSDRFGDKGGMLTAIAALVIIVFFIPYTASGFSAIGKLASSLFGIEYHTAMIVGAIIIVVYTVLGGFLAASTTDLIQSVIMTVALFVVVCFGIENAGGFENVKNMILGIDGIDSLGQYFNIFGTDGESYGFLPIVSTLAWGLGYFGMPHILLRFMAIENEKKLPLARRVASVWVTISMAVAIFIGVLGFAFATTNNLFTDGFDSENIIIMIANKIAELDTFAALLAGFIIAGILASIMSTADSQLLAASSSVSENIIKRFVWKNMKEKVQMWFARGTMLIIALIAVFLAWDSDSSVFRIVSFAWAGFGAAFGPTVLFALFWRRTTKWGALAGIVSGGVMVFVWKYLVRPLGGAWDLYELLPAFIISSIAIIAVSLITKAPDKEVTDTFDEVELYCKAK
ncbi:MAG: sodium/proline symporter [Clostridia bacterium]|nr:sodium/proline symporter [Clostridia bacterium]